MCATTERNRPDRILSVVFVLALIVLKPYKEEDLGTDPAENLLAKKIILLEGVMEGGRDHSFWEQSTLQST